MARFKNSVINLPEKSAGNTRGWESINVGILMDIRDELQTLNAVFACLNFQNVPRELRAIHRELTAIRKATVK